jgi:hypothetical protein
LRHGKRHAQRQHGGPGKIGAAGRLTGGGHFGHIGILSSFTRTLRETDIKL